MLATLGLGACHGDGEKLPGVGPQPEAVPIRRLTNAEYEASVTDLFPGATLPAVSFINDTRIFGFLNISSSQTSSLVRMEQYEGAAQAVAQAVTADPTALTGCDAGQMGELPCAQPYLLGLAKRAYRRPLAQPEKDALTALFSLNADTVDYKTRLGLAVQGVLMSPKFLFRPELGDPGAVVGGAQVARLTPWETATRLSYFLLGSVPDGELTAAADSGRLASAGEVAKQTQRLLQDPRAQLNLVGMHQQWLGIDSINALSKDAATYPSFNTSLAVSMGLETQAFLQNVVFTQGGTLSDLFLSNYSFVNKQMADFYGVAAPASDWARVDLDPAQRAGILTQPSLLATMAKDDNTDPVRRGKFVWEQILCRSIQSPSPDIVAKFQPMDMSKTARERFMQHRNDPVCATCHNTLDPLGLPYEHYDGMGMWRDTDRGMAIDATGSVDANAFDGIPQLAQQLVNMPEARTCYLAQWFRFSSGRLNGDDDQAFLDWLTGKFTPDRKMVDMVVDLVQSDNFRYLKLDPTAGSNQ
jgi:hypothetical protein